MTPTPLPRLVPVIALLTLCLYPTGCATIVHGGGTQLVAIESSPSGAKATIQPLNMVFLTPGMVELDRDESYSVTFELENYLTGYARIQSSSSAWLWGNLLSGGVIGTVVDVSSGGGYVLEPESVSVTLALKPTNQIPPSSVPITPSVEQRMQELKRMLDNGLIDRKQFELKQQELLEQL